MVVRATSRVVIIVDAVGAVSFLTRASHAVVMVGAGRLEIVGDVIVAVAIVVTDHCCLVEPPSDEVQQLHGGKQLCL